MVIKTECVYKTGNGILLLKSGDAFYITADPHWHLSNCMLVTELFAKEFMLEFGVDTKIYLR